MSDCTGRTIFRDCSAVGLGKISSVNLYDLAGGRMFGAAAQVLQCSMTWSLV